MSLFGHLNPDCTNEILVLLDKSSLRALAQVSKTASIASLPFLVRYLVLYVESHEDTRITSNFCEAVEKHRLYPYIRTIRLKIGSSNLLPTAPLCQLFSQLTNLDCISMELAFHYMFDFMSIQHDLPAHSFFAKHHELLHALLSHSTPSQVILHHIPLSIPRASLIEFNARVGIRYLSLRSPPTDLREDYAESVERLLLAARPTLETLRLTGMCLPGLEATPCEDALEYPKVKTLHIDVLPISLSALADAFPKLHYLALYSDLTALDRNNPDMWLGNEDASPIVLPGLVSFAGPKTLVKAFLRRTQTVSLRRLCLPAQEDDETFRDLREIDGFLQLARLTPVTSLTLTMKSHQQGSMSTLHLGLGHLASALPNLQFLGIRLFHFGLSFDQAFNQVRARSTQDT